MTGTIDINADLGESYGAWSIGADAELMTIISSANVACGFHAGDPRVMERTVRMCAERGVAIGAHPGYPDRVGFGRRVMQASADEIRTDVMYQIGALQAFCHAAGHPLHHVKPHGALYNVAATDDEAAGAIVEAMVAVAPPAILYAQAGGRLAEVAQERGIRVAYEAFADRAYLADGRLAPRSMPGAVLHDEAAIRERVQQLATGTPVPTIDGGEIVIAADTICVHADTPAAVNIARLLKSAVYEAGITVHPPK